jgi:hypothetical protein
MYMSLQNRALFGQVVCLISEMPKSQDNFKFECRKELRFLQPSKLRLSLHKKVQYH